MGQSTALSGNYDAFLQCFFSLLVKSVARCLLDMNVFLGLLRYYGWMMGLMYVVVIAGYYDVCSGVVDTGIVGKWNE
jgi:hypothetical protein